MKLFIPSFLLLLSLPVLEALTSGAAGCAGGTAAVGDPHKDASSGRPITTGTLEEGSLMATLMSSADGTEIMLDPMAPVIVEPDVDHVLAVTGASTYKGFLYRIEGSEGFDLAFTDAGTIQDADVCQEPVVGVTHRDSSDKNEVRAFLSVPDGGSVNVDITIVGMNNNDGSSYWYSGYMVMAQAAVETAPPTGAPSATEVAETAPPTVAPSAGSVVETAPPTVAPSAASVETPSPATSLPTVAPAPTLIGLPDEFEPCAICGEGMEVTMPDATVVNPIDQTEFTCGEIETGGQMGQIPTSLCSQLPLIVSSTCGCMPVMTPVAPSVAPPTPRPLPVSPTDAPTDETSSAVKSFLGSFNMLGLVGIVMAAAL